MWDMRVGKRDAGAGIRVTGMRDAGQIWDDLIPICRREGGVVFGNTGFGIRN